MITHSEPRGDSLRLEVLLDRIQKLDDPAARDMLTEIVEGLLDFHGEALSRLLEVVGRGGAAASLVEAAEDDAVSSLLALYGLHPVELPTRVEQALDTVRPYLKSHGGSVALVQVDSGLVRLRLDGSCHGCPSSSATLKGVIEKAILSRVPEIEHVEVVGSEVATNIAPAAGFVPLATLSQANGHSHGS